MCPRRYFATRNGSDRPAKHKGMWSSPHCDPVKLFLIGSLNSPKRLEIFTSTAKFIYGADLTPQLQICGQIRAAPIDVRCTIPKGRVKQNVTRRMGATGFYCSLGFRTR